MKATVSKPHIRHLVFWILPSAFVLLTIALYFSGSHQLVDWVAPRTPWAPNGERELGILENAQHLLLLATLLVLLLNQKTAVHWLQRAGMAAAAVVIAFALLEEIDYGAHYWRLLTGSTEFSGNFNYHNTSGSTNRLKQITDVVMVLWFVILPLAANNSRSVWLRYFAPSRLFILTLVAAFCLSRLAHFLDGAGLAVRPALEKNISEFREVFIYYCWLLYGLHMVRRPWPGAGEQPSPQDARST